jgi:hypothetical protein
MKTTPPAVSQARDIDGRRFPFGLRVLVLEAEEVVRAYTEAGKNASVAPTAAFKALMDPLLGPLRRVNRRGEGIGRKERKNVKTRRTREEERPACC